MKVLESLFKIVINWACKLLIKVIKKAIKEIENDLIEKIALRVICKIKKEYPHQIP